MQIIRGLKNRRFATAAQQLLVNFTLPHQVYIPNKAILANKPLLQVNASTTDGDMGILVGHVPTIAQLKPSVLSLVHADKTEKYFVSGGFLCINPDSSLNINAVEAVPLKELDFDVFFPKL